MDNTSQEPDVLKARIVEYLDVIRKHTTDKGYEEDAGILLAIAGALGSFAAAHMISMNIKPDRELGEILGGMLTESLMAVATHFENDMKGKDFLKGLKSFAADKFKETDDDADSTRH